MKTPKGETFQLLIIGELVANLYITTGFSLFSQGNLKSIRQGAVASSPNDPLAVVVTGNVHFVTGSLATAAVATVYDDDDDLPADWDYLYFWADQTLYVQVIAGATSCVFKVQALVPFTLPGFDSILPAASATPISGVLEPTLTDIDSVVIGNYSGVAANYNFAVID